jgi:hypothetical protein
MSGVPFCHPCDRVDGKWKDMGNVSHFGHDADGIGTGGFAGPQDGVNKLQVVPGNPLGVTARLIPKLTDQVQWLEGSLAPEDQVIPIINVTSANGAAYPATALIRHKCAAFNGALDVWIGQVAQDVDEVDQFAAEQLMARGVLWCLNEKGDLPAGQFQVRLAKLDQSKRPGPLPGDLAYNPQPRPWGDTYLPRSPAPASNLELVDVTALTTPERIALTCLQGLTSRKQPVIYLSRTDDDMFWLNWHREKGYIKDYQPVKDWTSLFKEHASAYKGAIIPDPKLYRGDLLALNVAACEDLIVATPELARKLGIPVKMDLRGRFTTYADGIRWVWHTYKGQISHFLCDYIYPGKLDCCTFSYDIEWKGLMFWPAGTVDQHEPGADMIAEKRVIADILSQMQPNTAVLGFPYAGDGVGLGEGDGVALASRYAIGLVCSDYLDNLCITSGVPIQKLEQPKQAPAPVLDRSKIYIALVMSDGDNENTWRAFFMSYFKNPAFGKFPLAFGMGPAIIELQPAVAQWYYEHATPGTEFISDVSGVSYTQPENYAKAYRDPAAVQDGFLDWTAKLMRQLGMRSVRTVGGSDAYVDEYAKRLPFCHSIFADMGRWQYNGIQNLTYTLPSGMPIFRAVTSWRYGKDGFLREIREQVGNHRPAFVNGFVHCWTFDMDTLAKIYQERDPDMVFVTPAQLADLYRQAGKKEG